MEELQDSPPRRSREQLAQWVQEFQDQGHVVAGSIRVAQQEDADRQDTGLVVMNLHTAKVSVYMQPRGYDDPLWEVTLSVRPDELTLAVYDVASLAAELVVAGNLGSFLQWKSLEWDRASGTHS